MTHRAAGFKDPGASTRGVHEAGQADVPPDGPELFRALLEAAPDAVVIVGETGRILLVNSQTEALFGYPREELLGQSVEVLVPERLRGGHVAKRLAFTSDPRVRPMGAGLDLRGRRKDGSEFPIEISLSPLRTGSDRLLVSATVRDVTERKKAELTFRGLLESAPDAMVIADSRGRIALVNEQAERLFGYAREEMLGASLELLLPERFRQRHVAHRTDFFAAPRTRPMGADLELFARRKDGSEFSVEISLSPLETPEGRLVSAAIRDITERKKAEREIELSLREKEVLLKEVHHRVKNNLQVVASLLSLQSGDIPDGPARIAFLESRDRVRSMALVHEILYQSKELSRVDFGEYVTKLGSELFRAWGADARATRLVVDAHVVPIPVDLAVNCGLIVNELVTNALKHAFPAGNSGEVRIELRESPSGTLRIDVSDTGIGFPPGFEIGATKTLGMQLVTRLSQQLRGAIVVEREPRTRFVISIPLAKEATS